MVFYMLPTRAWELCLGGLLALKAVPKSSNNKLNNWLSLIGLAMLIFSVTQYDSNTVFPGIAALIPCLGATLIIYTGDKNTIVAKILSFRGFVFIGLLSYSLYLWHWPAIVFFKNFKIEPITPENQVAILSVSIILSFFSWKFVEQPFRKQIILANKKSIFAFAFLCISTAPAIGAAFYYNKGMPSRFQKAC